MAYYNDYGDGDVSAFGKVANLDKKKRSNLEYENMTAEEQAALDKSTEDIIGEVNDMLAQTKAEPGEFSNNLIGNYRPDFLKRVYDGIKKSEGYRDFTHDDSLGTPTIGYGMTQKGIDGIADPALKARAQKIFDNGIVSRGTAEEVMKAMANERLNKMTTNLEGYDTLPDATMDAYMDIAYNRTPEAVAAGVKSDTPEMKAIYATGREAIKNFGTADDYATKVKALNDMCDHIKMMRDSVSPIVYDRYTRDLNKVARDKQQIQDEWFSGLDELAKSGPLQSDTRIAPDQDSIWEDALAQNIHQLRCGGRL